MNTGTLSGIDVLDFGKVEPGAVVELKDGSTATVIKVDGRRLSRQGVIPGSVQIRRAGEQVTQTSSADIASVLRPPAAAAG
jgi:hypothetical protein